MRYYTFDDKYTQSYRPAGRFVRVMQESRKLNPEVSSDWLDFSDRVMYITWVTEWKSQYKLLAEAQRAISRQLRRAHTELGLELASTLQGRRARYRDMLHALLLIRRLGKQHAQRLKTLAVV